MQTKISKIDYAIINCGYVDRLDEYADEIKHNLEYWDNKLLRIGDNVYGTTEFHVGDLIDYVKQYTYISGAVICECSDVSDAFRLAGELMEYGHCGCFDFGTLYEMRVFKYNDKKLLLLNFDTESG